jgi:two-component system phosphate regulon sensor histidine kinase PhoR
MRTSTTVRRPLEYLAVPVEQGVVRLAVDLDTLEEVRAQLRRELLAAGVLGLFAALVLSYIVSGRTLRPVAELRDVVQAIAAGDLRRRLRWRERDDLREIASSINSMAEQLGLRLEEATAEKEELQAVLTSMVEGVLVLDEQGRIVLANPRCRELLHIWGDVEGHTPIEVIRNPQLESALERASRQTEHVVEELELDVGTPEERQLLVHAVALAPEAVRARTVAVFHDVTEIRRLEQVRTDFIANASHELRTPLTSIRGFAETLVTGDPSSEELKTHLSTILRNAERLSNLIDDLLDLSRIESRKVPLRMSEIDVSVLCEQLVSDMKPRLADASITASVDAAPGVRAVADRRGVEQVLGNLIDNAATYSNPGSHIEVRCWREASKVFVAVQDTGIGIPLHDQARIFERFYRVDSARSRALGGTGLGLSIVKHLVQSMGGSISLESEVGKGSRFVVSLAAAAPIP